MCMSNVYLFVFVWLVSVVREYKYACIAHECVCVRAIKRERNLIEH